MVDDVDHRDIGQVMDLFHFQPEAVGNVFWHPNGWELYRRVEDYIRRRLRVTGYKEIKTPQLVDRSLWEQSGHWDKFRQNMFTAQVVDEDKILALKPMNCPCHIQVFNKGLRSYKELPLRLAEFGSCHRYEPSGSMHGLMRVRAFTQDDAHIFCTADQIIDETVDFTKLLFSVYEDFGFKDISVKFSDRPAVRVGTDEDWDKAEKALKDACNALDLPYIDNKGDGAFYGPKLEFTLKDVHGRDWQCGTLQVDFNLPKRLDATYVASDNSKQIPVMLHRAIFGSFERFIGILIEHYSGKFPLWLAPVQVVVATIVSDADEYANEVVTELQAKGIIVEIDTGTLRLSEKIAKHSTEMRVPVILVVGRREAQDRTVALRRLFGAKQEILSLNDAVNILQQEAIPPDLK